MVRIRFALSIGGQAERTTPHITLDNVMTIREYREPKIRRFTRGNVQRETRRRVGKTRQGLSYSQLQIADPTEILRLHIYQSLDRLHGLFLDSLDKLEYSTSV